MLILARRANQDVCIGDDVTVTVLKISGNRVLLGIKAPSDVRVDRLEVRERREQPPASSTFPIQGHDVSSTAQ